jgi:nitrogen fixation protein FixH
MNAAVEKPGFRITGWHFLFGIVAFFLLIIVADVYFATLAYKTFSGEAAKNPYEAGLLYNRTLQQQRASQDLGWTSTLEAHSDGAIWVTMTAADKSPLDGLNGQVILTRPATEAQALTLPLIAQGPGRYLAKAGPLRGAWDIEIALAKAGEPAFKAQRRVLLK